MCGINLAEHKMETSVVKFCLSEKNSNIAALDIFQFKASTILPWLLLPISVLNHKSFEGS